MRNSIYMSCICQIAGKIWNARKSRPQVLVFDLLKTITDSVAFQIPDSKNLTNREKRLVEAKPKIFNEDECKLLDSRFTLFVTKIVDVRLIEKELSIPVLGSVQSTSSSTNATSGSSGAPSISVKSTLGNSNSPGINLMQMSSDAVDPEMDKLISETHRVMIEDVPGDDINVNFFATDPYSNEGEPEGYEDWCYFSIMDEEAYENWLCEDPNNYYIGDSGYNSYHDFQNQNPNGE